MSKAATGAAILSAPTMPALADCYSPDVPAPEEDAWLRCQELVRSYAGLIRSAIRKVAGPAADLVEEDVAQRLLTDLWKRHRRETVIAHPGSYIYRAAVRETVRALQRERRSSAQPLDSEPRAPRSDDPHAQLQRKELAQTLNEEIDALRPDRARAVRFHLAGFAVDEIMALHAWSYSKARNLIARGMTDLRQRLVRRGIDR